MRPRRLLAAAAAAFAAGLTQPTAAVAHGFQVRSDLPIPEWLFGWAAAMVLLVSFVALAVLWPKAKLEPAQWHRVPGPLGRTPGPAGQGLAAALEVLAGAVGVALLGLVVYAGLAGTQSAPANFASNFVFVLFWLGLVPLSVLFGDVFRAFNPWRAIGRAFAGLAKLVVRDDLPEPLRYPDRLGRWPAALGLFLFAALELVATNGDKPETVAVATLLYSALTFVGMALYGVDRWIERGEAFAVYFNLFARMSPFERRDRALGVRLPPARLTDLPQAPGTVALLAIMIGSVSFDGASEAPLWTGIAPDITNFFQNAGLGVEAALQAAFLVGLVAAILIVYVLFRLGIAGARTVGGGFEGRDLANRFVHSLVPIAFAYVAAHYFTLLLFQGQALGYLVSNPLGESGTDLFGTADSSIDYSLIGANATWYWQVGFVVVGHVLALALAHDRALVTYDDAKQAVRSQYWMLAVMVGFTSLALWLLSQANA